MDKQFYSKITEIVEATLNEKGFSLKTDDGVEYYSDDKRAFSIEYNESSKLIELKCALLKEGEGVSFKTVSSWILDENSDERDMTSIGNDFSDTVLEQLGIKSTASGITNVDIPKKDKNAETINIENFTARFLSIYPAYKDLYKENVSTYGEFMYDKFFTEVGPKVVESVIKEGNKKHIAKMFELFNNCYSIGDVSVGSVITFNIFGLALIDDENLRKDAYTYMEKYTYLYQGVVSMINLLSKPKMRKKYIG